MAKRKPKTDVYQEITDRVIESLEKGVAPWIKPWNAKGDNSMPHNAITGRQYKGTNVMVAFMTAMQKEYLTNGWLTYNQARAAGGYVKKGEKGTVFIAWNIIEKKEEDGTKSTFPLARAHTLFNLDQTEQVDPEKLYHKPGAETPEHEKTTALELAESVGASIRHGGDSAFFSVTSDFIGMPNQVSFKSIENYEATLLHELTHWTGHHSRLKRDFNNSFGSEEYAFEELVAELGSAFLCAEQGVALEGLQHEEYIGSWIKKLKEDKRAIVKASSLAQKSTEFILNGGIEEEEIDQAA